MAIRLVDLDDPAHVLRAEVVKRRLHVVTIKRVVTSGRPFRPEVSWERTFDARSGLDLGDYPAFRVHPDDLGKLKRKA